MPWYFQAEVSTLSSSVSQVLSTQQSLQDRLVAMQTGQQHLVEELVSAGLLSAKSRYRLLVAWVLLFVSEGCLFACLLVSLISLVI